MHPFLVDICKYEVKNGNDCEARVLLDMFPVGVMVGNYSSPINLSFTLITHIEEAPVASMLLTAFNCVRRQEDLICAALRHTNVPKGQQIAHAVGSKLSKFYVW